MSKKKEVKSLETAEQTVAQMEAQETKVETASVDIESIKAQAKKEALAELQADLGITNAELEVAKQSKAATLAKKEEAQQMMTIDIGGLFVRINGTRYTGRMTVPAVVGNDIMAMAGKHRRRRLKEMVRHEYEIEQVAGGGFSSKLIKKEQVVE